MAVCDICNASGTGKFISSENMRKAVFKNGFNPYDLGLISNDLGAAFGLSPSIVFEHWKNNTVARDTSGWNVCKKCLSKLSPYLDDKSEMTGTTKSKAIHKRKGVTSKKNDENSKKLTTKEIIEKLDTMSDADLKALMADMVKTREFTVIEAAFILAKTKQRQDIVIDAFKQVESQSIEYLLDKFDSAASNFESVSPYAILGRLGNPAIRPIINRMENYPTHDPKRKTLSEVLTEITGKKFFLDNSNPEKWKKWLKEKAISE
jgi:hypothetical protein